MKRNLLYIALSLIAILLLSGCEKTSNMVAGNNLLTYESYGKIDVNDDAFDAQIVLHHYANGYGIIEFDRPITKIGDRAFYNCDSLTSITIPATVNSIGVWAFYDCDSLTSITIPDGVIHIGSKAFSDCDSLTSITIPDTVNSIGDKAFSDCYNLIRVYCMATTPPKLGLNAFYESYSRLIIYVPSESVAAYKNASGWRDYADVILGYDF